MSDTEYWILDYLKAGDHIIPLVDPGISWRDTLARWKVRWGVGRFRFAVKPGLYGIANHGKGPTAESPVFVTANYKMSFDCLRKALEGREAWILVLDTRGINVWCAAGKRTFGTEELIGRIREAGLKGIVSHNTLVLPQLGATGIAAHRVKDETGFRVIYGPVRAESLPEFIEERYRADEAMRSVTFTFMERLVLIPVELVGSFKLLLFIVPLLAIFHVLQNGTLRPDLLMDAVPFLGAIVVGSVLVPMLLPWIPGRSLAFKGWILGVLFSIAFTLLLQVGIVLMIVHLLLLPAISSFISLNFTGATTYTSLSGVVKEMQYALPLLAVSVIAGLALKIVSLLM